MFEGAGAVTALMAFVGSSDDSETIALAMETLAWMASSTQYKQAIADAGAIGIASAILQKNGEVECKKQAAWLLGALARCSTLAPSIANTGAIVPLVSMLKDQDRGSMHAATAALIDLVTYSNDDGQAIKEQIMESKALESLVQRLKEIFKLEYYQ